MSAYTYIQDVGNEQTYSLQLSDSVYLWTPRVLQTVHRAFARKGL